MLELRVITTDQRFVDDLNSDQSDKPYLVSAEKSDNLHPDLEPTGTDGLFSSIATPRSSLWNILTK